MLPHENDVDIPDIRRVSDHAPHEPDFFDLPPEVVVLVRSDDAIQKSGKILQRLFSRCSRSQIGTQHQLAFLRNFERDAVGVLAALFDQSSRFAGLDRRHHVQIAYRIGLQFRKMKRFWGTMAQHLENGANSRKIHAVEALSSIEVQSHARQSP
jgi:hypothetical protein